MVVNEVSPRGLKHHCTLKKPKLTYVVAITQVPLPEVTSHGDPNMQCIFCCTCLREELELKQD